MFPLAHVYFSTQVSKRRGDLLVLGSILPDIAWTSKKSIDPSRIHGSIEKLIDFLCSNNPDMLELGEGVRLHLELDYYAHDYKGGYAITNAEKINDEIASLLGIKKGKESLMMAHNFIEGAVDLNLKDKTPEILKLYQKVYDNIQTGQLLQFLSDYLEISVENAEKEFNFFNSFINPSSLQTEEAYAEKVFIPIIHIKFHKNPDFANTLKVFQRAREITKPTYQSMLGKAISLTINKT